MGAVVDHADAGAGGGLMTIVLDCRHAAPLARFWAEALGMHLDIRVDSAAHLDRLLALGATVRERLPEWMVMADPEGNEFCVFGAAPP